MDGWMEKEERFRSTDLDGGRRGKSDGSDERLEDGAKSLLGLREDDLVCERIERVHRRADIETDHDAILAGQKDDLGRETQLKLFLWREDRDGKSLCRSSLCGSFFDRGRRDDRLGLR